MQLAIRSTATRRQRRLAAAGTGGGQPALDRRVGALHPKLDDRAGIFEGDTAEALADLEFAVIRDPELLAFAQRVMSEAMERVIASHRRKG